NNQAICWRFEILADIFGDKGAELVALCVQIFGWVAQLLGAEPAQESGESHVHAPTFWIGIHLPIYIFEQKNGDAIRREQDVRHGERVIVQANAFIGAFERVSNVLVVFKAPPIQEIAANIRHDETKQQRAVQDQELLGRKVILARE